MKDVRYRCASQFLEKSTLNSSFNGGNLVEPISGDIFLGLHHQHQEVCFQAKYLHLLRNFVVLVYFVVYKLLPLQFK
jgi:hypothetical protein